MLAVTLLLTSGAPLQPTDAALHSVHEATVTTKDAVPWPPPWPLSDYLDSELSVNFYACLDVCEESYGRTSPSYDFCAAGCKQYDECVGGWYQENEYIDGEPNIYYDPADTEGVSRCVGPTEADCYTYCDNGAPTINLVTMETDIQVDNNPIAIANCKDGCHVFYYELA